MIASTSRPASFHKLVQFTAVIISIVLFITPLCAQQTAAPSKPTTQKNAVVKSGDPVFETLLSDDSYKVYGEVRNVGTLLSTGGAGEIVDPIMKLADPPKEFTSLVKFLNANAEMLAGSRLMFATWPAKVGLPNAFVAIELSSPEDAAKFEPKLNRLLPSLLPTPTPTPSSTPTPTPAPNSSPSQTPTPGTAPLRNPVTSTIKTGEKAASVPATKQAPGNDKSKQAELPEPTIVQERRMVSSPPPTPAGLPFVVTRSGSFVFVTDKPFKLEQLRPRGSKLLSEDQNFRVARDRFSSEPVFIYINVALVDQMRPKPRTKEEIAAEEERIRKLEEEAANEEKNAAAMPNQPVELASPEPEAETATLKAEVQPPTAVLGTVTVEGTPTPTPTQSQQAQMAVYSQVGSLIGLLGGGEPEWPDAVGIAVSQESDDYVIRAVLIGPQNAKRLMVPFLPQLLAGRGFTPNAPSVLPDETEIFVSASLDLPRSYEALLEQLDITNKERIAQTRKLPAKMRYENDDRPYDPFGEFEKKGGFKIREELLPALGNEIALAGSMKSMDGLGGFGLVPSSRPSPKSSPEPGDSDQAKKKKQEEEQSRPMILISITDREAARRLMPRVLDGLGIGEANLVAQTERRDDTELINFADAFAYAFVGDFVVISTTPTVRHVIDCYLNHQTLSSNSAFRNFTRWQPRDLIGQIYVSPVLMESYEKAAHDPSQMIPASMREYLMRLNPAPQAITYAMSNEAFGSVHELHLPKAFVVASVAGAASVSKEPPPEINEQIAMTVLRTIHSAEATYQATEGNGSYGSLDQLAKNNLISKEMLDKYGYRFDVNASGNEFEATATPIEYGQTGRRSFYIDQTGVLRGDDHAGAPANVADKPVQ